MVGADQNIQTPPETTNNTAQTPAISAVRKPSFSYPFRNKGQTSAGLTLARYNKGGLD